MYTHIRLIIATLTFKGLFNVYLAITIQNHYYLTKKKKKKIGNEKDKEKKLSNEWKEGITVQVQPIYGDNFYKTRKLFIKKPVFLVSPVINNCVIAH